MVAASRRLRDLQSSTGNKICADCSQKNPQWASVSYGVFMCLECSGKNRGLGVHISFVRSVTMDSWSDIQIKKMEAGGNNKLNAFLAQYSIPKKPTSSLAHWVDTHMLTTKPKVLTQSPKQDNLEELEAVTKVLKKRYPSP